MCCKIEVHVWRQLWLVTAKCLVSFASGINLSFPSVFNPAVLSPNSDVKVTSDEASWIVSSLGISAWIGYTIISSIFEIYGRKVTNIVISLITIISSIIICFANNVFFLILGRLIQGLAVGGSYVTVISICECISPKRRGYSMVLYKVSLGIGSLACHSLSFVLNWRQIIVCGGLPSGISIIIFLLCAESPSFLAKKGRFDECVTSFTWYRGNSVNANIELSELIRVQKESYRTKNEMSFSIFKKLKTMMTSNSFRKSLTIVTLATLCIDCSGRYFLLAYITQILTEVTNNVTSAMYISIAFDCILIFALSVSYFLVRYFNRRTLLFTFGYFTVFLMFLVSVSIIVRSSLNLFHGLKWLTLAVILFHTFVINVGLVPVAFALTGEVYSIDHRGLGSCLSGIVASILITGIMKLTPLMIEETGVEGTYAIYGFCLCVFLVLLSSILPETKDKTLQQIEDEIKGAVKANSVTELTKYTKVSNC